MTNKNSVVQQYFDDLILDCKSDLMSLFTNRFRNELKDYIAYEYDAVNNKFLFDKSQEIFLDYKNVDNYISFIKMHPSGQWISISEIIKNDVYDFCNSKIYISWWDSKDIIDVGYIMIIFADMHEMLTSMIIHKVKEFPNLAGKQC